MITIEILKDNSRVRNYLKKIQTNVQYENFLFYIDYYVLFSSTYGKIFLFLDTSTISNFYKNYNSLNCLFLQYITEISLEKTIYAKRINEYTDEPTHFILKDGELKFIYNKFDNKLTSWKLDVSTLNLYISNKTVNFPYFDFIYNIDILRGNFPCNTNFIVQQKLNKSYVNDLKKYNNNKFISLLFEKICYNISYPNAYIYNLSDSVLIKPSDCNNFQSDNSNNNQQSNCNCNL